MHVNCVVCALRCVHACCSSIVCCFFRCRERCAFSRLRCMRASRFASSSSTGGFLWERLCWSSSSLLLRPLTALSLSGSAMPRFPLSEVDGVAPFLPVRESPATAGKWGSSSGKNVAVASLLGKSSPAKASGPASMSRKPSVPRLGMSRRGSSKNEASSCTKTERRSVTRSAQSHQGKLHVGHGTQSFNIFRCITCRSCARTPLKPSSLLPATISSSHSLLRPFFKAMLTGS